MKDKKKLLDLKGFVIELNHIKDEEIGEEQAYPITIEQIIKYRNPNSLKVKRYRSFYIPKKNGEKREISAPYRTLNSILHFLNTLLSNIYEPNVSAMGFVKKRSVVDNAKLHVGHNYVFNMDLKDFFTSINESRVVSRLRLVPFRFTKSLALTIAGLCSVKMVDEYGKIKYVLPQGAPTSPLLSNAICDVLDRRMRGVAKKYGLHYSRYADDITFSSMHNVYQKEGPFMQEIRRIIVGQGFTINEAKTRLQKKNLRQEVTGLVVNNKPNVTRQYVHDLRCIIHIWEKYGYADAYSRFYLKYKNEKGHIKKGEPILENVIEGKLNYLRMVKGDNDIVYEKLMSRYSNLLSHILHDKETDKNDKYLFVESYIIRDFEKKFGTEVGLRVSEKESIISFCILLGKEVFISVSKDTQEWLRIDGKIIDVMGVKVLENQFLSSCFISLCRRKGRNFWFITKDKPERNVSLKLNDKNIPIDELINLWRDNGLDYASMYFKAYARNSIGGVFKKDEREHSIDVSLITPDRIKRLFNKLKKNAHTDEDAYNEVFETLMYILKGCLLPNYLDRQDNGLIILPHELITQMISQLISQGWPNKTANSFMYYFLYNEYAKILFEQLFGKSNQDKCENYVLSNGQINSIKEQFVMNGWSEKQMQPIIDYIIENQKKRYSYG